MKSPIEYLTPISVDEAQQSIRDAAASKQRVRIVGGETKTTSRGAAISEPRAPASGPANAPYEVNRLLAHAARKCAGEEVLLCTRGLNRVVELSPGDMTCTVEAGVPLRELDAALAPHGLRLPLDPPDYDGRATIGGVIAANDSGPLRAAYGTVREHVIGMSMMLADGTLIKAGGRVVKNVAGYDLHRLFVGSFGSLGLIATVSLKLRPRAEALRLVTLWPKSIAEAEAWTAALLSGPTRPAILDWLRPGSALGEPPQAPPLQGGERMPTLVVGFEDSREAVDWQVASVCAAFQPSRTFDTERSAEQYSRLRARDAEKGAFPFCAAVPMSRLSEFFSAAPQVCQLHSHATGAAVHGSAESDPLLALDGLRRTTLDFGGWFAERDKHGAWRRSRADHERVALLESRMKKALDPNRVFPDAPFVHPFAAAGE